MNDFQLWILTHRQSCTGTVIVISANLEYKVQQDAEILRVLLSLVYLNRIKLVIKETGKDTEMLTTNYVNFKKN
jgi:hypothetical protein